jgi:hypothetical protein
MDLKLIKEASYLFLFVLLLGLASAASCNLSSSCSPENTLMRLSNLTNAHGSLWGSSSYPYYICCDFTGDHSCYSINKIIKLSSETNAHAQIPSATGYNTNVCFANLNCISQSGGSCNSTYPISTLSLFSSTNSHMGTFSYYDTKICCQFASDIYWAYENGTRITVDGTEIQVLSIGGTELKLITRNYGFNIGDTLKFAIYEADTLSSDD